MWILAMIFDVLVSAICGVPRESLWAEDLKNRDNRGMLKKPSDKYVC